MTPKFDRLCIEFLKKIPDQFREPFTAGVNQALPNANSMTADQIINYVNGGMLKFFKEYWKTAAGDTQKFISIFPELIKFTNPVPIDSNGQYEIKEPYNDFHKLIGAVTSNNKYIKAKPEYKYTLYLAKEYDAEYSPNTENPAIIQVNKFLAVFPTNLGGQIKLHYIQSPIDPVTGAYLAQNGATDSPFADIWNSDIVDLAYLQYLQEVNATT